MHDTSSPGSTTRRLRSWGLPVLAAALLTSGAFYLGMERGASQRETLAELERWRDEVAVQRQELKEAKAEAQAEVNALALRIGKLQGEVLRLNALGQTLAEMGDLDAQEFDFEQPPPQGGPDEGADVGESVGAVEFERVLGELDRLLQDRESKLAALDSMLRHGDLQAQLRPTGRPVTGGWLSSYYGKRADPFTGKKDFHRGMDFAGKTGSDVVAVASGVVTWSGYRSGYGYMVEIDHGNDYVTRYGHNQRNLVLPGDRVTQGQRIALLGSSGRATGPHVHFEVIRDGKSVNPSKYISARP